MRARPTPQPGSVGAITWGRLLRRAAVQGLAVLWLGSLLACSPEPESAQAPATDPAPMRTGGIYRLPLPNAPASLDPVHVKDRYGVAVVRNLFDGLVQFGPYLGVRPALAETWQVEQQGRVYRFELRAEARFHNGMPVTAGDVVFSLARLLRAEPPPAILPHLLKIQGAEAYRQGRRSQVQGLLELSPHRIEIRLVAPHAPFLAALAMYQAAVIPRAEAQAAGQAFGRQPVGSGPFRFQRWHPDEQIRLERFDGYYGGDALLEGIEFQLYPGGQSEKIVADFRSGQLHEMPITGGARQELADLTDLQWQRRSSLSLFFYGFNCRHTGLRNPEVRRVLFAALDRRRLVREVFQDRFDIATTVLPPGMPGHRPAEDRRRPLVDPQNLPPAIASELARIGTLEIVSAYKSPTVERELALLQSCWKPLGISLTVRTISDWHAFEQYLKSDRMQIFRYAWFADMPDPDSFMYPLFSSESPVNFTRFADTEVDRLLGSARAMLDPVERAERYHRIEARVFEAMPILPLFYMNVDRVYQGRVQGIQISALGAHAVPLHRVWLK